MPYEFKFAPSHSLYVGKSKRGKSNFIKNVVLSKCLDGTFQFGMVFCKTKFNHGYDYLPDHAVIEGLDMDRLQDYLAKLKMQIDKTGQKIPNFIIFDDLQGVLTESGEMNSFFSTARHYGTSIFIAVQYLNKGISTTAREQIDYVVAFNNKTSRTINNLYDEFGQLFDNVKQFKEHFMRVTSPAYTAMVYDEGVEEIKQNYLPAKALAPEQMEGIKIAY